MQGLRQIRQTKMSQAALYSQEAVAKAIGVSKPTYRSYERDPGKITRKTAEKLASYLGCTVEDIFNNK